MKKLFLTLILANLLLGTSVHCAAQSDTMQRAVLTGEVVGDCKELLILTYNPDRFTQYFSPKFENGNFLFEYNDVNGFMDLGVGLDEEVYGVRLYAGDSLHVLFTKREDGTFDVDYFGKNERESRIWTDFYNTYEYFGQYNIRPDKDTNMSTAQSLALLAEKESAFLAKHRQELNRYHLHRAELMHKFLTLILIEDSAFKVKKGYHSFPEYTDIIASLDPNDPLTTSCGLISRWYYETLATVMNKGDVLEVCFNFIEQKFGQITCPTAKSSIASTICNTFTRQMEFTSESKYTKALKKLESLLPDYPELVANCRKSFEDYKSSKNLVYLPEVTLETLDGTNIKLSEHYGKVLYIDFWATWCGPCVKETPYMEKLAERYRGDDRIEFISISTDDNVEAWRQKVGKDNPFWPQYRIDRKTGEAFQSNINLKTIPRFLIVLPNGKINNLDAPRPSEIEAVTAEIDKALHIRK